MSRLPIFIFAALAQLTGTAHASFSINAPEGALPSERELTLWQKQIGARSSFQVLETKTAADGSLTIDSDLSAGIYSLQVEGFDPTDLAIEENESVELSAQKTSLVVTGSPGTRLLQRYEILRKESLARLVYPVREDIKRAKARGASDEEIERLTQGEVDAYQAHLNELNDFVVEEVGSSIALYATSLRWTGEHRRAELERQVEAFAAERTDTEIARELRDRIQILARTAVGEMAPPLTADTLSGDSASLEQYQGRYVLVDFWASWCPPCRVENLHYSKLQQKIDSQRFTIFAVNLDTAKPLWSQAVRRDKANWVQVSDLEGWKSPLAAAYGVTALPASFLLDPKGRIIAKNLRGPELDAKLKSLGLL